LFLHLFASPFGAFMTLLYGLTAAPASQPRNALAGQAVSMAIAVAISCAPPEALPAWAKQSAAGSLAIAAMVKLGVTHPPAGASAVLLAAYYPRPGWRSALTSLLGNAVAIAMAALVNNLSNKRQYPIYWGLFPAHCRPALPSRARRRTGASGTAQHVRGQCEPNGRRSPAPPGAPSRARGRAAAVLGWNLPRAGRRIQGTDGADGEGRHQWFEEGSV
jgi:CBS-domain-containing membrane protein